MKQMNSIKKRQNKPEGRCVQIHRDINMQYTIYTYNRVKREKTDIKRDEHGNLFRVSCFLDSAFFYVGCLQGILA